MMGALHAAAVPRARSSAVASGSDPREVALRRVDVVRANLRGLAGVIAAQKLFAMSQQPHMPGRPKTQCTRWH